MSEVTLKPHQLDAMRQVEDSQNQLYALDMGLGKTFVGSEQMMKYPAVHGRNLIVCQKSKVGDWLDHMRTYYPDIYAADLTKPKEQQPYSEFSSDVVGIINYELLFRRKELMALPVDCLMLDESSLIQNEQAKRTKAVLKMDKQHVILLSGTVVNGKYERLWSQCQLLGWNISKKLFWNHYIVETVVDSNEAGYPVKRITGYKNIARLKRKLREYGGVFMKTEDVIDLPDQTVQTIRVSRSKDYVKFDKDKIIHLDTGPLVGDMQLTERLYKRLLCAHLNQDKVRAFEDLLDSTEDRLIVFYNFQAECDALRELCESSGRPVSVVNGETKDLGAYETEDNSVTLVQYQAGSMGLNLQKANKIVYFTPPDGSSENFEQSKKRIHRIGQKRPCFYYLLICEDTVEEEILVNLAVKKDRTDYLWT